MKFWKRETPKNVYMQYHFLLGLCIRLAILSCKNSCDNGNLFRETWGILSTLSSNSDNMITWYKSTVLMMARNNSGKFKFCTATSLSHKKFTRLSFFVFRWQVQFSLKTIEMFFKTSVDNLFTILAFMLYL